MTLHNKTALITGSSRADADRLVAETTAAFGAMAFLASDDAAYITGQTLRVNGGMSMG